MPARARRRRHAEEVIEMTWIVEAEDTQLETHTTNTNCNSC
jgi:hypothetical protein